MEAVNGAQRVPVGYEQDGTINHNFARMLFDNENNIWTIHEIGIK